MPTSFTKEGSLAMAPASSPPRPLGFAPTRITLTGEFTRGKNQCSSMPSDLLDLRAFE